MGKKKDRFWDYAEEIEGGFRCKFCHGEFRGSISRIKPHLAKFTGKDIKICTKVPEDVQKEAHKEVGGPNKKAKGAPSTSDFEKNKITSASSSSPSTALHHLTTLELCNKKDKSAVDKLLAQLVVLNNIPIDVVQTASFRHFVGGVAEYGPDYSLPSDSTLKTKLIPDLRMEVEDYIGNVNKSWKKTGCTLMLDLWGDKKQGDFISIIVYSPKGAVFMKPIEIPNERKEESNLANTVSSVIEEIGPDNVVQFITNARKFEPVRDKLVLKYPRMYKTRCAAHGIHLLMKDIYKEVGWLKKVIDDATLIVEHMHKNTIISLLRREHTSNKELKRPCMTRFASNFLMLQSIFNVENELRPLVASSKWRELDCNKEDMAKRVTSIIEGTEFWSQGQEVLAILNPFVRVLQLAESDGSTSGYLYEAMERAKGEINQQCGNNQAKSKQIWELFEERHSENIIHPIHAAAAFLNPAYMCSENFREDDKMNGGIEFIHENLVAIEEKKDFMEQVQLYRMKVSTLFNGTAKTMLETSHPWIWWDYCGRSLPILRKYAIRILSQPCSSSSCERNWSAFEAVKTMKKNRWAAETLDNLVYVRMNAMMMEKSYMMEAQGLEPIDLDQLSELPEYADHKQGWEGYALDASDEDADQEKNCDDDAFDATDKEISSYQMENVGESIVSAILQQLFDKLSSPELQQFAQQNKVDTELKKLETFLWKIFAVLDDAEEKHMVNSDVQIWLTKLTDLAYDVEDILDKIGTEALRHKLTVEPHASTSNVQSLIPASSTGLNSSTIISPRELTELRGVEDIPDEIGTEALRHQVMVEAHASTSNVQTLIPASSSGLNPSTLNFNVNIRSEIDKITSRLQEIVTQKDNLNLREKPGSRTNKLRGGPPTASLVDESHVYGREKDKETILELLLRDEGSDDGVEEGNGIIPGLSYHHLPSHLKRCFAYCAIFPKGWEFDEDELVLLWMAEGFLQEPKGKKHMEDLGHQYFLELLSRSFFQQSSANKSRYVMHDHSNYLAKSVAGEICFNLEGDTDTLGKSPEKVRHLAYNHRQYDVAQRFEVIYQMKSLRTFLGLHVLVSGYDCRFLSNKVLHDLLPKLRYLRSLSLTGYEIRELPDSIGDLKHLRYLNLSYSTIKKLPESMSALLNLQTLILHGCRQLNRLPAGIGNLIELHHLDISETVHLVKMPSGIGNLTNLQTLPRFTVGKRNGELGVKDLKNLSHLRGQLSIVKLHNVVNIQDAKDANLEEKQGLDDLVLDWSKGSSDDDVVSEQSDDDKVQVLECLQPHRNLKKLTILCYGGARFPSWISDRLISNLVQLKLCNCSMSTSLPSLGQLPLLKDLRIEGMCAVKTVGLEFYGVVGSTSVKAFPSLESLSFKDMGGWKEWSFCTGVEEKEVFPCLRKLVIQNCPKLIDIVGLADSSVILSSLCELEIEEIEDCNVLISDCELTSLTTLKIRKISEVICLNIQALIALEVLEIEECGELKMWEDGDLACLKKLVVKRCHQLVSLAGEEGGLLPCNLEELELKYCNKLEKLPNGLHSLTCLRSLSINSCPKLMSFPATGLPYILKRLELIDCQALESLPDGMTIHGCNSSQCCFLEELVISNCPSLKYFPREMLPTTLKKLKISNSLKSLEISYPAQLKSLLLNNTSLEVIRISDSWNLRSLPLDCLHTLTHLSELAIIRCDRLESFPEGMGFCIPNLKSLEIGSCMKLKSLPNQMHNFTSLQKLNVSDCEGIVSFPEGGLPPNLTSIEISCCKNLKQSMSEWGLYRLSSLRQLRLVETCPTDSEVSFPDDDCSMLPKTLTNICISNFRNLQSISRGIKNLTSLEKLEFWFCTLQSLPKEGLPASLGCLDICGCYDLEARCLKEKGEYWPIISHIPCVKIGRKSKQRNVVNQVLVA